MSSTNPYRSPDAAGPPEDIDEPTPTPGRPHATARLVRSLEYVIALLIVMALIWVVQVFVLAGDLF